MDLKELTYEDELTKLYNRQNVEIFDDIFNLADKALYEAKKRGKNIIIKSNELQKIDE